MESAVLELKNVYKKIGGKHIIKDVSFSIQEGEVFGFIGPNGAGKTTTIRMIVGLMKITSGDILLSGKSIQTDFKAAVQNIGAIVENPELYPFMTGMQNLKQFARMTPGISKERIEEVIKLVRLEKAIHEKVQKYSLGMKQRLGIAQALLHEPKVLILDEPTNGLDPSGMREIREYIRHIAKEDQVAVIISSHLLSEIELMCDRIGIIKNGSLIATRPVHIEGDRSISSTDKLSQVAMEISEIDRAIQLIREKSSMEVKRVNGQLHLQIEKEKVPSIISEFVENDIKIYQVIVSKATLEDTFLELIGENIIG